MGVDRSTYSYYEIGRISPDISTVMKLSSIFEVPYSDILNSEANSKLADNLVGYRSDSSVGKEEITFNGLSYEEKRLIVAFRLLSEDDRKNLMNNIVKEFKTDSEFTNLQ